jgi:hypothetical protein
MNKEEVRDILNAAFENRSKMNSRKSLLDSIQEQRETMSTISIEDLRKLPREEQDELIRRANMAVVTEWKNESPLQDTCAACLRKRSVHRFDLGCPFVHISEVSHMTNSSEGEDPLITASRELLSGFNQPYCYRCNSHEHYQESCPLLLKTLYVVETLASGFFCRSSTCGVFTGDEKEFHVRCRSCGAPRPLAQEKEQGKRFWSGSEWRKVPEKRKEETHSESGLVLHLPTETFGPSEAFGPTEPFGG